MTKDRAIKLLNLLYTYQNDDVDSLTRLINHGLPALPLSTRIMKRRSVIAKLESTICLVK